MGVAGNQYATDAQLQTWLGTQAMPAEPDRLLQRASDLLDRAMVTWRYTTDAVTFLPTDPVTIAAFASAVCAQVEWWMATLDDLGELATQYDSTTFEGITLNRAGKPFNPNRLAPRAYDILLAVPVKSLTRGIIASPT